MSKIFYQILLLLLVGTFTASLDINVESELNNENRCGGPIEADSGSLTFPPSFGEENGENLREDGSYLCIWTIHLQTTSLFRLSIPSMDIPAEDLDCADGGVRIYPLTNMLSEDGARDESFNFCNHIPPPEGYFYLPENLIAVVYYASANSSETSGFRLEFGGLSLEPVPKIHESSFTSATSGIIRYPVFGEYLPNRVSTWSVKTGDIYPDLQFDMNIAYIRLEPCQYENPCMCDALMVYEVTSTGIVREVSRLCENTTGVDISGMGANFIVGFFTDNVEAPGVGQGFELIYQPLMEETPPPPTTTTPVTTTEAPSQNYTTECGGVLSGDGGLIEYKLRESYEILGRCLWTIRSSSRTKFTFTLNEHQLEYSFDHIQVYTFDTEGEVRTHAFSSSQNPQIVEMEGTVAVVTFHSDRSISGSGFSLSYEAGGEQASLNHFVDLNMNHENRDGETIRYPLNGPYQNLEFSTFILARPTGMDSAQLEMNITELSLEVGGVVGECKDKMHISYIRSGPGNSDRSSLTRFTPFNGICDMSLVSNDPFYLRGDAIVIRLLTDSEGQSSGFQIDWKLVPYYT